MSFLRNRVDISTNTVPYPCLSLYQKLWDNDRMMGVDFPLKKKHLRNPNSALLQDFPRLGHLTFAKSYGVGDLEWEEYR